MYEKTTNLSRHEEATSVMRVARMANALSFANEIYKSAKGVTDAKRRTLLQLHATWLMGGYLYQAVHLVDDLSTQYGRSARFRGLMRFAEEINGFREVFAEFNLSPAFSMDWGGDGTRQTIASLELDFPGVVRNEFDASDPGCFFANVHRVDSFHLQDKLAKFISEEDLPGLILSFPETILQFVSAAKQFIGGQGGSNTRTMPKGYWNGVDDQNCHSRVPECFRGICEA
jgi:hypothetical protein